MQETPSPSCTLADEEITTEKNNSNTTEPLSSKLPLVVSDFLDNHVPIDHIPALIKQFFVRSGIPLDGLPDSDVLESMAKELHLFKQLRCQISNLNSQPTTERRTVLDRKELESKLKNTELTNLVKDFPFLDTAEQHHLVDLLTGAAIGRYICHVWCDEKADGIYNGKLDTFVKDTQQTIYKVAYWSDGESSADSQQCDMSVFELGADFILGELVMSQ